MMTTPRLKQSKSLRPMVESSNQKVNDADINDTIEDIPDSSVQIKAAGEGIIKNDTKPKDMIFGAKDPMASSFKQPQNFSIQKGHLDAKKDEMDFEEEKKENEAAMKLDQICISLGTSNSSIFDDNKSITSE